MRYTIIQNQDCYQIYDNVNRKCVTEKCYPIIIDIIEDKYAIVGESSWYWKGSSKYRRYLYGLIDMEGNVVVDIYYQYIYPQDDYIYCKLDNTPLNILSFSGNYLWYNDIKCVESKYPFVYMNSKWAVIRLFEIDGNITRRYLRAIDYNGNTIKEKEVPDFSYIDISSFITECNAGKEQPTTIHSKILGGCEIPIKWSKLNHVIEEFREGQYLLFNVFIDDKTRFESVHLDLTKNRFLLISKNNHYIAIINDKLKLIYEDRGGFYIERYIYHDRLVINGKYILDDKGNLFELAISLKNIGQIDENDYLYFIENDKRGYIDKFGKIVIPPLFSKDEEIYVDEFLERAEWEEEQRNIYNSIDDAFEGESDAYWNID